MAFEQVSLSLLIRSQTMLALGGEQKRIGVSLERSLMFLTSLRTYHFRNLDDSPVSFGRGVNFIFGKNGQGKSNLLEAVSLLSAARSFRTTRSGDLVSWGKEECSLSGTLERDSSQLELLVTLEKGRRSAYVNGERQRRLSDFVGQMPTVTFSPSDLEFVKGGPGERRRFMDRYLCFLQPTYFDSLSRLNQILRNKSSALKSGEGGRRGLESLNQLFIDEFLAVCSHRIRFIRELAPLANEIHQRYAPEDRLLTLHLESQGILEEGNVKSREQLEGELNSLADRERIVGKPLFGPQRDDILIALDGKSARSFASQGQSRSIVLSLLIAILELLFQRNQEYPILLLDDVESELDSSRKGDLFSALLHYGCQTIISGTECTELRPFSGDSQEPRYFRMEGGRCSPGKPSAAHFKTE